MDDREPRLSERVVKLVAERTDSNPFDLQSLYETVDLEALDALFRTKGDGDAITSGNVSFPYAGVTVTVRADGRVDVHDEATNVDHVDGADEQDNT